MLYYELQALLQHNCNLAVAYLALVAMKAVFDDFFQIRNCNMLYYELQSLLQHNCNLAVTYLALVAMKAVFDEVFFSNT
jgi:hypothetical protein